MTIESSLRACQARETFSRPAGMRAGGRVSNHMARRTCHMRIPDTLKLRPYIKRNEACTTGTPAPAIARWRCNELIISARQSCEYKRCSRHTCVSKFERETNWANVRNFEIFPIICVFLSSLSLLQRSANCDDSGFLTLILIRSDIVRHRHSQFCSLQRLRNFDKRVSYLWNLTHRYRIDIKRNNSIETVMRNR